ncbi:hypothetical protein HOLleu_00218 [Holothuria leucospilota]|uniref:Uncharacterized protein n=1 Tax=Holothuria leucospilota TaxID=206669 RepID=A0A9Q1CNM9_HOLLE|nr:hypothetical protein HOLleu_00218 [Holothuria leucospilota]
MAVQNNVRKSGFPLIAETLIRDLKVLETEGIVVESQGEVHNFHGTVSCITADNLGSHAIGGFTESFTGTRICSLFDEIPQVPECDQPTSTERKHSAPSKNYKQIEGDQAKRHGLNNVRSCSRST